jgi:hypothetical protein
MRGRRLRLASGVGCAALIAIAQEGAAGCGGGSCVEQGVIELYETPDHLSEACSLMVAGRTHTATYVFPAWTGSDIPCAVQQGPAPGTCVRAQNHSSPQVVDWFLVFFQGDPEATGARAYFGGDDLDVTLTCGTVVLEKSQRKHFVCFRGL